MEGEESKFASWFGAYDNDTGLTITTESALALSAYSAGVRLLAETVGMLPLKLYTRDADNNKSVVKESDVSRILAKPNTFQTPMEFREMAMGHLLLRGNFYAEQLSTGGRGVDQLMPLHPDRVTPFWAARGVRAYRYQPANGESRIILDSEMFHVMFFSIDGLSGLDPVSMHRRELGLLTGAEKFGAKFFKNDATPTLALEYPGKLKPEARQNVKESWTAEHQGVERSHKTAILEEGMKVHQLSITPENAQFLSTLQNGVQNVARMLRVPPHLLYDLTNATFSNIEMQSLEYVIYSLTPWLSKWEQRVSVSLLNSEEQETMFAEFLVDALLRGDIKARYTAYQIGKQNGWLNANEIRAFENMNGIGSQGDVYTVPLNMANADEFRDLTEAERGAIIQTTFRALLRTLPRNEILKSLEGMPE